MKYVIALISGFLLMSTLSLGARGLTSLDSDSVFLPYSLRTDKDTLSLDKFFVYESDIRDGRKAVDIDITEKGFVPFSQKYAVEHKGIVNHLFTYKTYFYIDESLKRKFLSVYVGLTDAPKVVYLNGIEIYFVGNFDPDPRLTNVHPYSTSQISLSRDLLHYGSVRNEIAIQLFGVLHYEPIHEVTIGPEPVIAGKVFLRDLFELHLVQAMFLLAIALSVYFLFLFITRKFKEKGYLFFSLLCLFFAFSNANLVFSNDAIGEYYTEMFSRVTYPIAVLFLAYFIFDFTGIFSKSRIAKIVVGLPGVSLSVITLLQKTHPDISVVFANTLLFYILPCLVFNIVLLIISIIRKKDIRPAVLFIAYVIVFLAAAHDMSYVLKVDIPYAYLLPIGFLCLIMSIFFVLAYDQSTVYIKSVDQALSLNEKNKSLEGIIGNVSAVSQNLGDSYARLRSVLADSSGVIDQYEESNKKITTDVIVKFNDVEELLKKITGMIEISSEKVPRAVSNQTAIVKRASSTLNEMSGYLESNISSVFDSSEAAKKLSELAGRSSEIIKRSKLSITTLKDHSRFLQDVLNAIEEISEKTGILSINAAIEAARQGQNGKGFAIIASEIRGLSNQSKATVTESLGKVKAMLGIVDESTLLSEEVENSLSIIIRSIGDTSAMISKITDLIENQRRNSSKTASEVENLLRDTLMIETLTREEQVENQKIQRSLSALKDTFLSINNALKEQSDKGAELVKYINIIHEITNQNLENVAILRKSI